MGGHLLVACVADVVSSCLPMFAPSHQGCRFTPSMTEIVVACGVFCVGVAIFVVVAVGRNGAEGVDAGKDRGRSPQIPSPDTTGVPLCPSCKAPLTELLAGPPPRCGACRAEVRLPGRRGGRLNRQAAWRLAAIVGAALSLGAAGLTCWTLTRSRPSPPPPPPTGSWDVPRPERWTGVLPTVGPFFGEGREDLVGLLRDGDSENVVAIDGESFAVRWSSPVSGDGPIRTPQLTVVGQRVAWARGTRVIHVVDLATGSALPTIRLAEATAALCPHPTEPGRALVVGSQGARASIDLEAGTVHATGSSVRCPDPAEPSGRPLTAGAALPAAPQGYELGAIPGAYPHAAVALADGDLGVAFVVKRPGFPSEAIVGFGVAGGEVRWSVALGQPLVRRLGVGDGQVALLLEAGRASRFVVLDARTGAVQWEAPLPCGGDGFQLGATRAYVMIKTALLVFERGTGRLVHTVGTAFCR